MPTTGIPVLSAPVEVINTAPYVEVPALLENSAPDGVWTYTFDLNQAISDVDAVDATLSYEILSQDNPGAVATLTGTNNSTLVLTSIDDLFGVGKTYLRVCDNDITELCTDFIYTFEVLDAAEVPVVVNPMGEKVFDEDFGVYTVDLYDVFQDDTDADEDLNYEIVTAGSVGANVTYTIVSGHILQVTSIDDSFGGTNLIRVKATDMAIPLAKYNFDNLSIIVNPVTIT